VCGTRPWAGWAVVAITILSLLLYAAVPLLRWWHFDLDSYDLALYHQIVWRLSRLTVPAVSILGEANYFGDHFSPILTLFAPLYWVVPSAATLVIGQALLIAASIPAVYLYARRRISDALAVVICLAYAQSWGVLAAVDSPVHEVVFAVPLLAWGIYFADVGRWRAAYACLGALLLVKEDFGLVLAAFGLVLAVRGARRRGLVIAGTGLAALVVVNALVMPALDPRGWSVRDAALYGAYGDSAGGVVWHLTTHPVDLVSALGDGPQKPRLIVLLLGAFAGLPLLSPLTLLVVPQVLERLLAGDPNLWGPSYQYSIVPMVVLALAAADGAALIARWTRGRTAVPATVVACSAVIAVVSAAAFPLDRLRHREYWKRSAGDEAAASAVRAVPRKGSVAGDRDVLAHVQPRDEMFLLPRGTRQRPRYVVLRGAIEPGVVGQLRRMGYGVVKELPAAHVYGRPEASPDSS
jgi:uncharacterized membrane protein